MEANVWIPLLSALIGAVIGAASSIGAMWVQQRAQSRREKLKLASEMALADHRGAYEAAAAAGVKGQLLPIMTWQHLHFEVLSALESGKLTTEDIERIWAENQQIEQVLKRYSEL